MKVWFKPVRCLCSSTRIKFKDVNSFIIYLRFGESFDLLEAVTEHDNLDPQALDYHRCLVVECNAFKSVGVVFITNNTMFVLGELLKNPVKFSIGKTLKLAGHEK